MEVYALLIAGTTATLITVPLLIRMAQKGLSVWVRLYVALLSFSVLLMGNSAITGYRPHGYTPEVIVSVLVALGVIYGLVVAYSDRPSERAHLFRLF